MGDVTAPPRISKRAFIKWGADGEREEPTDTYVLTSPSGYYVDIRTFKAGNIHNTDVAVPQTSPQDMIEWAFAGKSRSEVRQAPGEPPIVWGHWDHWIDSRTRNAAEVVDEGKMLPPDSEGLSVEKGRMVHPQLHVEMDYEEGWLEITPRRCRDQRLECAVLRARHGSENEGLGVVVLVGQFCQGIVRFGDEITVERWEWTEDRGWARSIRIGGDFVPCGAVTSRKELRLGDRIHHGGVDWEVIEVFD